MSRNQAGEVNRQNRRENYCGKGRIGPVVETPAELCFVFEELAQVISPLKGRDEGRGTRDAKNKKQKTKKCLITKYRVSIASKRAYRCMLPLLGIYPERF